MIEKMMMGLGNLSRVGVHRLGLAQLIVGAWRG